MHVSAFHFLRPEWLLALLPLLWLLWRLWRQQAGHGLWHRFCDAHLLPHLLEKSGRSTGRGRVYGVAVAGALLIVALAGPVWRQVPQALFQGQSALVIVLDLSVSMEAGDWQPSRLVRAKQKVIDLLRQRREGVTALVVFAGEGFVVTPLTQDSATIVLQLAALEPKLLPVPGSRPDRGVQKGLELLRQSAVPQGQLLLLTDGWDGAEEMAQQVTQAGHRLAILGVGTPQGAPIPMADGGFLKDGQGSIVVAKLDEEQLRRVARWGGGAYQRMQSDDGDWQALLSAQTMGPIERSAGLAAQWQEEGPWLVVLALPLLALAYRRGVWWVWLLLLLWPQCGQAMAWADWWQRPDQQALKLLQAQQPAAAAERFSDPLWRGVAQYQAGQHEKALQAWQQAPSSEALYNAGTVLAEQGNWAEAAQRLQEVLQRQPDHTDARHNLHWVQQRLQQQQQRQQEKPGQSGAEQPQQPQQSPSAGPEKGREATPSQGEQGKGSSTQERKHTQAAPQAAEGQVMQAEASGGAHGEDLPQTEAQQTAQFWMRRIPDDPGGLLRRKFLYQYQRESSAAGRAEERINPW
ncbi:MAG: VWA domain-containing protein [Magnetococcales bacterium]|nr:VWA domain-containing protein [Magnetococcales bacterium]MBF0116283.1 VWA domain-containing protein [Magnetococcales bacterium]